MMNFIEDSKYRKGYKIINNCGDYELCRILNEYDNEKDASKDLMKLLGDKCTENEILKDYSKKSIF